MRKSFTMTNEQMSKIREAGKPVHYMIFGGRPPPSSQENANRAWAALGQELGFAYMTVQPDGPDPHDFTAEEVSDEATSGL